MARRGAGTISTTAAAAAVSHPRVVTAACDTPFGIFAIAARCGCWAPSVTVKAKNKNENPPAQEHQSDFFIFCHQGRKNVVPNRDVVLGGPAVVQNVLPRHEKFGCVPAHTTDRRCRQRTHGRPTEAGMTATNKLLPTAAGAAAAAASRTFKQAGSSSHLCS